jgi:hypothetical protein
MIIEAETITENKITFNRLTHTDEFFAVGYGADKVVRLISPEDDPIAPRGVISSKLNGFGATDYAELITEAKARELKGLPDFE